MFSHQQEEKRINVIVKIVDGSEVCGLMSCGLSGSIESTLNKDGNFIEVRDRKNEVTFISKRQIATVVPAKNAEGTMPDLSAKSLKNKTWADVLGVNYNSTPETVKEAYHGLAKRYHPDLFTVDMPLEIKEYAHDMLSRINLAYEQYKSFKQAA